MEVDPLAEAEQHGFGDVGTGMVNHVPKGGRLTVNAELGLECRQAHRDSQSRRAQMPGDDERLPVMSLDVEQDFVVALQIEESGAAGEDHDHRFEVFRVGLRHDFERRGDRVT